MIVEQLKHEVMAGLFMMFIMAIALGEIMSGTLKEQEESDLNIELWKIIDIWI